MFAETSAKQATLHGEGSQSFNCVESHCWGLAMLERERETERERGCLLAAGKCQFSIPEQILGQNTQNKCYGCVCECVCLSV